MSSELHHCAASGNLERGKQLVEGGTNMEELDGNSMTALSLASRKGRFDIVAYLVECSENVAHTGYKGRTALHCACTNMNLPTVKFL
jgi:ankyrin repeat protein